MPRAVAESGCFDPTVTNAALRRRLDLICGRNPRKTVENVPKFTSRFRTSETKDKKR